MTQLDNVLAKMTELVAEESNIAALMPGVVLAEIHLHPDDKIKICQQLNILVRELDESGIQLILTVLDDMENVYVRIISEGIKANEVDSDQLGATVH